MIDEDEVLSITQVTARIKAMLEDGFPEVTVEGEISNFKAASSGHYYFNLKDSGAMIQAVMFRSRSRGLSFEPADGLLVRARGAVSVYAPRGQYQIIVDRMEPAGEGNILAMLEERKRRLAAEGLFDDCRKRALPRFPSRVVVITSPTGAAIHDIINVVKRRNSGIDLILLPAAVQGESAPAELLSQLRLANKYQLGDVIIIGRGGGSLEDLLAFSDENLVRAIAASEIPVVSAVGHEIDWALSDFAADLRAPTPSAAAELVTESRLLISKELSQFENELETAMHSRLERARLLLGRFEPDAVEAQFMRIFTPCLQRFDEARDGILLSFRDRLADMRHRLEILRVGMEAASPDATLARGYAIVRRNGERKAIRDSASLKDGELLDIHFARGGAKARTEEISK